MTTPIVIGNTKAYINTLRELYSLQDNIWQHLERESYQYYFAIPSTMLGQAVNEKYKAPIFGTQTFDSAGEGSYTGDTTLKQIKDAGAKFTILGHSEKRKSGESSDHISDKVRASVKFGMMTVLCVGEQAREEGDEYLDFIKHQLEASTLGVDRRFVDNLVIAYEPVWAIGAAKPASANQVLEIVIHIRRTLVELFGLENAKKVKVIYGGSVTQNGVADFVKEGGVDGVLVGRASCDAREFATIVNELYR